MDIYKTTLAMTLALGLSACMPDNAATIVAVPDYAVLAADAISSETRPEKDREADGARKPGEVIAFAGVKPGMSILEMEAGRGYYTELFAHIVGPDGAVIMQNPPSFDSFLGDSVMERLADNRLANVRLTKSLFDSLDAVDSSIDLVTWFLGPHELYYLPSDGIALGEPKTVYAEIKRVMKPGGYFVVLDHFAPADAPQTTGGLTHRISPKIVKALAIEAGFTLVGESDILHNPDDDLDMQVFDPSVRRKTSRFLIKFQKPE